MLLDVRTAATAVAAFIIVTMIGGLISANVRLAASRRGWDTGLDQVITAIEQTPVVGWLVARIKSVLPGWSELRHRWWLWLVLGLSGGVAISLWVAPSFNSQVPTATETAKVCPSQVQQCPAATGSLGSSSAFSLTEPDIRRNFETRWQMLEASCQTTLQSRLWMTRKPVRSPME
jgi:hypothetical protein